MIVIGKGKKKEEVYRDDSYRNLEEFSKEILDLGKDIEDRLIKKRELEDLIAEKEKEARAAQKVVFDLKNDLAKVKSELLELEKNRTEGEGKAEI